MTRVLAANVHLVDEDGTATIHRAGTTPPKAVAALITNPSAWADEGNEATSVPSPAPEDNPPPPAPPAAPPAAPPEAPPDGAAGDEPARNASTEVWQKYAEGLGQTVEDGTGRDAIIAQLVAAGLIKE